MKKKSRKKAKETTPRTMKCEGCNGAGLFQGVVYGAAQSSLLRNIPCLDCKGKGFVPYSTVPYCR